jgi:hypothetical protein
MNDYVRAVIVFDDDGAGPDPPALYAGGQFTTAGGNPIVHIAKWDGASWSGLGGGMSGYAVFALAVFDDDGPGPHPPALYAAGSITNAGGTPANNIAKWDGTSWTTVGGGTNNWILALAVYDDDGPGPHLPALYAGGYFTTAGGQPASRIARWDGTAWSEVGGGTGGVSPGVYALKVFDDDGAGPHLPALYAGGTFTNAGGTPADHVAKWDGTSWSALGSGTGSDVYALAGFDEDGPGPQAAALYVAGMFWSAGGQFATHIARWDGSSWQTVGGTGVGNVVHALLAYDDDGPGPHPEALYVGGYFTTAGPVEAHFIAKWTGRQWQSLGGGTNDYVMALTGFDADGDGPNPPVLIAGGRFTVAGGLPIPKIAAWSAACSLAGDMNCDGQFDACDVQAFVQAVVDPGEYAAQYPGCDVLLADVNGDGAVDLLDVAPFVDLLMSQ